MLATNQTPDTFFSARSFKFWSFMLFFRQFLSPSTILLPYLRSLHIPAQVLNLPQFQPLPEYMRRYPLTESFVSLCRYLCYQKNQNILLPPVRPTLCWLNFINNLHSPYFRRPRKGTCRQTCLQRIKCAFPFLQFSTHTGCYVHHV